MGEVLVEALLKKGEKSIRIPFIFSYRTLARKDGDEAAGRDAL
jgi:hypothetical protein